MRGNPSASRSRFCTLHGHLRFVPSRFVSSWLVSFRLGSFRLVSSRLVSSRVVSCRIVSCRMVWFLGGWSFPKAVRTPLQPVLLVAYRPSQETRTHINRLSKAKKLSALCCHYGGRL